MARGFSLLEVLIASAVITVALVGLVPLLVLSTKANEAARSATVAAVLARQKMEQLRALAWSVGADGVPLSDTTTDVTVDPEVSGRGVGLRPSPAATLERNVAGYCDLLDADGRVLPDGAPSAPVFVRRWSVDPLPSDPANTLVLQVRVVRADAADGPGRRPDEARITSVKARKAS